ncbi:predicted protein [Plenodomus lingam JN3]|uniref:Predicted protein n=1 Tax=Leptosphaeria maculans (strain JN3 / isolate v23.1.3 / race Av1-4-5-6-7-8) TaxID=985895 RepID=E5A3Q2_LEPMJ|nr:predicted protein [Plenodomus lingam JN3]CBX98265.1 predicted protein [Plenodomus lingam JN3]
MNDEGNWNVSSWYAQIQSERRDMCCSWKRQSFPLLILMVSTPSSKHLDNGSSCDPMEHLLRKQYPTLEVDLSTTLTIWIIDQLELQALLQEGYRKTIQAHCKSDKHACSLRRSSSELLNLIANLFPTSIERANVQWDRANNRRPSGKKV